MVPATEPLARLVRPAKPIEGQTRDAHKERAVEHLALFQSLFASARVVPGGTTAPARRERREGARGLGQVFVRIRDRVRDDAFPWAARSHEGFPRRVGRDWRCWRCGESIVGGVVEIFDGERGVAPRDVPSCARREV